MEEEEVKPAPAPPVLETMSIEALYERIAELEAEIAKAREMIAQKEAARSDANLVFRK